MARGSPLRQPCNQYWIFLEISSEAKTPAKPLGSMYWSELPFNQFEMNQSDLIDMVLLSQNRISSLSAEEVVQCSLPCTKKTPLLSKPSLNPSVTKCQRLSPATHKLTSAASTLDRWWWTVSTASTRGVVRARAPSSHSVKTTGRAAPNAAAIYPANTVCPVARSRRLSDRQQQGGGTDVGPRLTGNPDPEHASSVKLEGGPDLQIATEAAATGGYMYLGHQELWHARWTTEEKGNNHHLISANFNHFAVGQEIYVACCFKI